MLTQHLPAQSGAARLRARVSTIRQGAAGLGAVLVLIVAALTGSLLTASAARADDPAPTPTATPVPASAPQAGTGPGTAATSSSATLSGTVITGGADTAYHFEYGTTTAYGLSTAPVTVPAASSPAPAVAKISGLTARTTYHYRLVATNAAGVALGADAVLTTPAPPHKPGVAARASDLSTATTATIVGRVNPYGQPTTYHFEWGTSSKVYGQVTAAATVNPGPTQWVTFELSGLQPNTRYVYRVVATNASGTVRSSPRSVTTGRGLSGVSLTATRRTLSWAGTTVISGVVQGNDPQGTKVHLLRQDFPFERGWYEVGTQKAGAGGAFAFTMSRIWDQTRLKVVADSASKRSVESKWLTLRTRVLARLSMSSRRSTSVRLRGVVYPAVDATRVSLQRRTSSGRWIVVSRPNLRIPEGSRRGTFSLRVRRSRAHTLRYRLVVTPNDDHAHVTTAAKSVYVPRRR